MGADWVLFLLSSIFVQACSSVALHRLSVEYNPRDYIAKEMADLKKENPEKTYMIKAEVARYLNSFFNL